MPAPVNMDRKELKRAIEEFSRLQQDPVWKGEFHEFEHSAGLVLQAARNWLERTGGMASFYEDAK